MCRQVQPNSKSGPMRWANQQGLALLLVLWVLLLAGILGLSVAGSSRTGIDLVRANLDRAQAEAIADAGVHEAIFRLLAAMSDDVSSEPLTLAPFDVPVGQGLASVRIEDEDGKIDLNAASEQLLAGLFGAAGMTAGDAQLLAEELVTQRGENEAIFGSIVQLRGAGAVSQDLFEHLESAITVWSHADGLDPKVASPIAVQALPRVTAKIAERLISGEMADEIGGLDEAEPYLFRSRGQYFTVRSEAAMPNGARYLRIAIIGLTRGSKAPFQILEWRQGSGSLRP